MQDHNQMSEFLKDSLEGLQSRPKHLSSKYFYDKRGDALFKQIMQVPEYYLSDCESEILSQQAHDIAHALAGEGPTFDLLELGPGDGSKSIPILQALLDQGRTFRYLPVDISGNALKELKTHLEASLPQIQVKACQGDYFGGLGNLKLNGPGKQVILWLGANIGNMPSEQALQFCRGLHTDLKKGDRILIGMDLMKYPSLILNAYSDPQGITREFNLNLLERMNRELGADFKVDAFQHYVNYDPQTGTCRSYLISLEEQAVRFKSGPVIYVEKNEAIRTEISQKYRKSDIEALARTSGFTVERYFEDSRAYFTDVLWSV